MGRWLYRRAAWVSWVGGAHFLSLSPFESRLHGSHVLVELMGLMW